MNVPSRFDWPEGRRWQRHFLIAGGAALVLCALGAIVELEQCLRSLLFAYFSCFGIALGSLALWMLHNLTRGEWGHAIRPHLEAATRTLPLLAFLFVPILAGVTRIYPWVLHPTEYLNVPFFFSRAAIYFAVWLASVRLLTRWSEAHERTGAPAFAERAQQFSGPGLVLYGLTVTFASVDWVMSLEPAWSSTIFGVLVASGHLLAALALAIAVATLTRAQDATLSDIWNDLGNLLLAFVMLWTYLAFSQFLVIWSGNLPEEIIWYLHRTEGGWQWLGLTLAVGYFALPFVLLLSPDVKRNPQRLRVVALLIFGMSVVLHYWLIAPAHSPSALRVHWLDLAAIIGVGGVWFFELVRQIKARPIVPIHQPPIEEVAHA